MSSLPQKVLLNMYGVRDLGVTLSALLLASSSGLAQQSLWPAAVSNAAMAWDSSSGQVLLYGGMRDRGVHADSTLWAWNGTQWSPMGDGAPGARSGLLLVSDPPRHRIILYGGQSQTAQFDDTWEWRDGHWARLAANGPGARHMTAGAFDPVRHQLVLFGGYSVTDQRMLGDTWVWNGEAWRKVAEEGPPPRAGHVIGFDAATGRIILMGGADARGLPHADTWSWDGTRWSLIADGPGITPNTQLVQLPQGGLGTFGGWDGARPTRSLYQWNGTAWMLAEDTGGPSARMETALGYDPVRRRLILFGGSDANGVKLNDLWEYDGRTWREVTPH